MELFEKSIDSFYGTYKKPGLLGKKYNVKILLFDDRVEGSAFALIENEIQSEPKSFSITFDKIERICVESFNGIETVCMHYQMDLLASVSHCIIALLGIEDVPKWFKLLNDCQRAYVEKKAKQKQYEIEEELRIQQIAIRKEEKAVEFYNNCYSFHIKEDTPIYPFFSEKNKVALIYVDKNKSLNFLKIDGYAQEENNGVIEYKNIHYYDKAGNVSYVADINGNYTSFVGGVTGGNFSKLAAVGGGLLFGMMGIALGTALSYKPSQSLPSYSSFTIDTDVKKIDDRNVILNFYSDMKKQYVDIELPQDIYNFLQTYLPEKKLSIVEELEKKTVVHQATNLIENGDLLRSNAMPNTVGENKDSTNSMEIFKQKVEKLKMMRDAEILTEQEFENEKKKLLAEI